MALTPTAEQQAIIDVFDSGDDLIIQAGAGTGKTSTLRLMAEDAKGYSGLYFAFNRSVAEEARATFPGSVQCRTAHSLAYGYMKNSGRKNAALMDKLNNGFTDDDRLARFLFGIVDPPSVEVETEGKREYFGSSRLGRMAMASVRAFCQSADDEISEKHLWKPDQLSWSDWKSARAEFLPIVIPAAQRAWAEVTDPDGEIVRFGHEHYLKLYGLSHPQLGGKFDYLFLDEAQDASPVIADIFLSQKDVQLVAVGDSHQAIYGFTGAVDALALMEKALPTSRTLQLTESFRFGPAVAAAANNMLELMEGEMRLTGRGGPSEVVVTVETEDGAAPPDDFDGVDAVLVRTNAGAIREALASLKRGLMPYLVNDVSGMLAFMKGAKKLMQGRRTQHPELESYANWNEFLAFIDRSDEAKSEYQLLIDLIDQNGIDELVALLHELQSIKPAEADLHISTAHKAKGLEWGTVRLADDFPDTVADSLAEQMLLYVAATRAKHRLLPGKSWPVLTAGVPISEGELPQLDTTLAYQTARAELDGDTRAVLDAVDRGEEVESEAVEAARTALAAGATTHVSAQLETAVRSVTDAELPSADWDATAALLIELRAARGRCLAAARAAQNVVSGS